MMWAKDLLLCPKHLQKLLLSTVTAINLCYQLLIQLVLHLVEVTLLDPERSLFISDLMPEGMLHPE